MKDIALSIYARRSGESAADHVDRLGELRRERDAEHDAAIEAHRAAGTLIPTPYWNGWMSDVQRWGGRLGKR